jgi:hypothetical protein
VFHLSRHDAARASLLPNDNAAVTHWLKLALHDQMRWAERSPYMREAIIRASQSKSSKATKPNPAIDQHRQAVNE